MDHSKMNHDMPMPGGPMDDMCSMSMLFTWDTTNLCVIFKWWHVRTSFDLFATLVAVVLMGMGYEYIKLMARRYDARYENSTGEFIIDIGDICHSINCLFIMETPPFFRL